jgi:hypothetical protein
MPVAEGGPGLALPDEARRLVMASRDAAKNTLVFYFQMLAEKAGIKWDSDNVAEVGGIVDDILDAAKYEAKGYER